ncbi:MAG: sensor histidine kinase [Saprospiraceae bacterium]|nr:sensor histidine kinase [Saprospiraceae bacterium]
MDKTTVSKFSLMWLTLLFFVGSLSAQLKLKNSDNINSLANALQKARDNKSNAEIADVYFITAEYYQYRSYNFDKAFENYVNARQYYLRENDVSKVKFIDLFIADRYVNLGLYQEGLDIYEDLLQYYEEQADLKTSANILYKMSRTYRYRGDSEKNLELLNKAESYNKKIQDTLLIANIKLDKIESYIHLNEKDSALIVAAAVVELASKAKDDKAMSKALYFVGYINYLKKSNDTAIKYLLKSLQMLPTIAFSTDKRAIYKLLARIYEADKDNQNSLKYFKLYSDLNDSILNQDRLSIVNELAIRYSLNEKDKQIANVQAEKESVLQRSILQSRALYFVGIGFLLLLGFIYYLIRFYMHKIQTEKIINTQQHEIDQQKIRELEDKIKINSMQAMIVGEEKERERIAKDLHDSLGGLLSTVKLQFDNFKTKLTGHNSMDQYNKATNLLDNAVEEVRSISRNLQPTALKRYGLVPALQDLINRLDQEGMPEIFFQPYDVPEKIDEIISLSVFRVIQELLNNSIKYAKAKEILIQLNSDGDELYLQYEDDGIGFDYNNLPRKGMGLENIYSRINYLKGNIVIDSKPEEGVYVMAKVPLKIEGAFAEMSA